MTEWIPLLVVAIPVVWLRFKMAERLSNAITAAIANILAFHGTKTLFNGQPRNAIRAPTRPNRAIRRRDKRLQKR